VGVAGTCLGIMVTAQLEVLEERIGKAGGGDSPPKSVLEDRHPCLSMPLLFAETSTG